MRPPLPRLAGILVHGPGWSRTTARRFEVRPGSRQERKVPATNCIARCNKTQRFAGAGDKPVRAPVRASGRMRDRSLAAWLEAEEWQRLRKQRAGMASVQLAGQVCQTGRRSTPDAQPRAHPHNWRSRYDRPVVERPGLSRTTGIGWEDYYRATEGRPPRPLFRDAIAFLPARPTDDRALVAIDLGCGDGTETLALLTRGWMVTAVDTAPEAIARLRASVPPEDERRLTTFVASFHELELPEADFVYAGLSLPFCSPPEFAEAWRRIKNALRPDGIFAGHFFGPRDSWADQPGMTFQSREELEALLAGFAVHRLEEQDEDGPAVSGPKHWHVFHVIALKRQTS
jgi:SAM-dependent methyltransferase